VEVDLSLIAYLNLMIVRKAKGDMHLKISMMEMSGQIVEEKKQRAALPEEAWQNLQQ
jgi:hypothetical protein